MHLLGREILRVERHFESQASEGEPRRAHAAKLVMRRGLAAHIMQVRSNGEGREAKAASVARAVVELEATHADKGPCRTVETRRAAENLRSGKRPCSMKRAHEHEEAEKGRIVHS